MEGDRKGVRVDLAYRLWGGRTRGEVYAEAANPWTRWAPKVLGGLRVRF